VSEKTGISWTDATFNPWWSCTQISPGCDNCYAKTLAARFGYGWNGAPMRTFGDKHWKAPTDWAKQDFAQCEGCGWRGNARASKPRDYAGESRHLCPNCEAASLIKARRRVFCASMGDWLDLDAPISEFVRLLDLIRVTPELDWLLLSKRIGNWRKRLTEAAEATVGSGGLSLWISRWLFGGTPPANVWLGATVVNQEEADRDIPKLLAVPARVRFLSIEPMLSPISFDCWPLYGEDEKLLLHWIIAGGEGGPYARPLHVKWVRSIVQQCKAAGVAVHVKQLGARIMDDGMSSPGEHWPMTKVREPLAQFTLDDPPFMVRMLHAKGGDVAEWPADLRIQEFPA
jgi:protein gp37